MQTVLLLAALLCGPADLSPSQDAASEVRALRGYLGLVGKSLSPAISSPAISSPEGFVPEMVVDLRGRLERLLDRPDLPEKLRVEAIDVYRDLARALARSSPGGAAESAPRRTLLREIHADVIRRAETAGIDLLPLEIEMLLSREVGLDAHERYARIARLLPRIKDPAAVLGAREAADLRQAISLIHSDRSWPAIGAGEGLTETVQLLLRLPGGDAPRDGESIAQKLAEWTGRFLSEAASQEGQIARGTTLIHLYQSIEASSRALDPAQRARILAGLQPLESPSLGEAPANCEGAFRSVEVGEVRLPPAASAKPAPGQLARPEQLGHQLPRLSPALSAVAPTGYLLAPKSFYQVDLIAIGETPSARAVFRVLARPGAEAELVLPRCIPQGMVPITSAESGRITFLADKRPWSNRRFLLAVQRSGSRLSADAAAVARLFGQSSLREVQLPRGVRPDFASLVGLLTTPQAKDQLEETFWVEAGDRTGRSIAFELAGLVLSGNTGLRDTALSLPTVAEANRLWREGEHFGLDLASREPAYGLFNAIRLIPDPRELGERTRYVVRTVLRLAAP